MPRDDFKAMLGMGDRGVTDALGALVKRGPLKFDSSQGKVRFALCCRSCGLRRIEGEYGSLNGGTVACYANSAGLLNTHGIIIRVINRMDTNCKHFFIYKYYG